MSKQRALITGITGQDAYYLSELLLEKDYKVYGLIRGQHNPKRHEILPEVELIEGDLTDFTSLRNAISIAHPHELYNLGAITHVGYSFKNPEVTSNVTGMGPLRLLEVLRQFGLEHTTRFYQASTSELFGDVRETPQTELTPFYPRSPYGVAKAFAHYATVNYREAYGIHASCGILFNHESERRGYEFVTRKVTRAAARISLGLEKELALGNLEAKRDWGYAPDFVDAMWRMLQEDSPGDYVIATNKTHSIRDLLDAAFGVVGLDWHNYVVVSEEFKRPSEVDVLTGDYTKANQILGWYPTVTFREMISRMVLNDLQIEMENLGSVSSIQMSGV